MTNSAVGCNGATGCTNGALHPSATGKTKGAMHCTHYVGASAFAPFRLSDPASRRLAAR